MASETNKNDTSAMPGLRRGGPGARFASPTEKAANAGASLKALWGYFMRDKLYVIAIIITVMAGTAASITAPDLQSHAIDIIAGSREGVLLYAVLFMLCAYLCGAVMQFAQGILSAKLSQRMVHTLRKELFSKLVDLPVGYLDRHQHGDLMSRMTNDVENISTTISQAVPSLTSAVLTITGTAAFMLYLCWQLALLSFAAIVLTLLATRFLAMRIREHSAKRQSTLGALNARVEEMVSSYPSVVAFNRQGYARSEFNRTSDTLTREGIKTELYSGILGPVMNCIGNLDFVIICAAGGYLATEGLLTVGVISAFIVYAKQFSRPVNEIGMIYGQIQTALAGAERVFAVTNEVSEDMSGRELPDQVGTQAPAALTFDQVNFSYDGIKPIIQDFSLQIPSGAKVALVGATGSGKTTIANLLLRFYDPSSGSICLNGEDITGISRGSLRHQVAVVPQETIFFTDTVRNNVCYGNPEADDEELRLATRRSLAEDAVDRLSSGFSTVMVNAGASLSQGERQLLSIARAFVVNPRILILDEATSSVDTRTELAIQQALQEIMRGRTCIIIAHRLSTIRDADTIVVLDHGRIVESGSHQELILRRGAYYELYQTQYAGFAT